MSTPAPVVVDDTSSSNNNNNETATATTTTTMQQQTQQIPVIRFRSYEDGEKKKRDELDVVARQLRSACEEVGFFYLTVDRSSFGIDGQLVSNVLEQSKTLFGLSTKSKKALSDSVLSRGYTGMEEETLDPSKQRRGDTKEGYYIGEDIGVDYPLYDVSKLRGPNQWPTPSTCPEMSAEQCEQFKSTMEEYYTKMSKLGLYVVQMIAMSLGVNRHYFDEHFAQHPMAAIRLLHYNNAVPSNPDNGVYGCGSHTDYGMITLLLTDGKPGLQILTKDGEWIDAPSPKPPGDGDKDVTFIVNLGDMLERYTNGMYRSTPHRVLLTSSSRDDEGDRYSVPFFYEPNFDAVVECLDCCCCDGNPPKYPPTTSGRHLLDKYKQTHADFTPSLSSTKTQN